MFNPFLRSCYEMWLTVLCLHTLPQGLALRGIEQLTLMTVFQMCCTGP